MQSKTQIFRRRSQLELDISILQVLSAHRSLKLTHIMYKSNINAKVLKKKLITLEEKDLIVVHKLHKENLKRSACRERKFYGLTPKGLEVLRSYLCVSNTLGCD